MRRVAAPADGELERHDRHAALTAEALERAGIGHDPDVAVDGDVAHEVRRVRLLEIRDRRRAVLAIVRRLVLPHLPGGAVEHVEVLREHREADGLRELAILDGDLARKNLSSELGFSKEHRDTNIRRLGFVAAEITKHGGIAICAPIAPYDSVRQEVRALIAPWGGFLLVYVSTPLRVCEERDRKGLYAKARAGVLKEFTGVSDPYEPPKDADIVLDTTDLTPEEAVQEILLFLEREGYIGPGNSSS